MASESGGGFLGGLVSVSGPENLVHESLKGLLDGSRSQANTREHLIASGLGGVGVVAEQQASRLAGKAFQEWARENRKRAKRGLPEIPMPMQAQYDYGEALRIVTGSGAPLYQNQPQQQQQPQPQQPPASGSWWGGINWDAAIQTGLGVAELVAYFRDLFSTRNSGSGSVRYTIPQFPPGTSGQQSPYQTTIPATGGGVMPYLLSGDGGGGFLGNAGSIASGIGTLINAIRGGQATSMPGGAMNLGNYGGVFSGMQNAINASGASSCAISPFKATRTSAAPQPWFLENPATGALTWFKPAGRPLLWSGDLSTAKRVKKIARMAKRRAGGC